MTATPMKHKNSLNYQHVAGTKAQTEYEHITINDDKSEYETRVYTATIPTQLVQSKNKNHA